MSVRSCASLALAGFGLLLALGGSAAAQPAGAQQAVDRFLGAFAAGDLDGMVALHAPDAVFLPTTGGARLVGHEAIRGYYARIFAATAARSIVPANEHWQTIGDDVALRTAEVRIEQEFPDGRRATTPSRLSVAFRREGEGWRIVQMHSCAQTAPPAAPR